MVQKRVRVERKEIERKRERQSQEWGRRGGAAGLLPLKGTVWRLRSLSELVVGAITVY